ncbi:MAG: contact-dependent growth inhibition system immunity protein [Candidatus Udaeobacter sp.]
MLAPSIANKSLAELSALGPYGEADSHIGEQIRALAQKPLRELSSEDLAFLLRQSAGLQFVIPLALERLSVHPLTHRDYYPGVLLVAALGVDESFWRQHAQWRAELNRIAQRTLAILRGRSHKTREKFRITLDTLTEAYDTFAAATSAV